MKDEVIFRGTRNGVLMVLNDQTDYTVLKERLAERLAAAENFFYPGAGVTLDVGSRVLSTAQLLDLEELLQHPHGLKLINVIHSSPSSGHTDDAAASLPPGGSSQDRNWWGVDGAAQQAATAQQPATAQQQVSAPPAVVAQPTVAERQAGVGADAAADAVGEEHTVLIKRTLRSGQRVRYNGNIVILGEVNPGAEVIAAGDIIVMGALRGVAHAGAGGREDAIVVAFRLQPTQLRIAGCIGRPPEGEHAPSGPELARIKDGAIMIEADPHRFF